MSEDRKKVEQKTPDASAAFGGQGQENRPHIRSGSSFGRMLDALNDPALERVLAIKHGGLAPK